MKKATNGYPQELVEIVSEAYPGYWPLTRGTDLLFPLPPTRGPDELLGHEGPIFSL